MDEFKPTAPPNAAQPGGPQAAQPEFPAPTPAGKNNKPAGSKSGGQKTVIGIVVLLVLLVAIGAAVFFWGKYNDSQKQVEKLSNNPANAAQQQTKALITSVGKLTVLPTGENPTVATVTDVTKLADQPFFANAKNGDKVLIYTTAKKAYLYRPSTNKIINIAPVNLGSSSSSTTTPSSTSSTSSTTTTTNNSTTKKP